MNSRLEKDEDVVTISSCSSSASSSSTEKSSRIERSKELSHRLPPVKAQPLNGFDDSDFLSESTPDDLSAGDIRWLFNQKTGSFSVYSKMVEQKKRYEQQIVLPVHPSIRNSGESVGLHLHRNIFNQAFQDLTLNPNENLPLPSSHTAYLSNNEQVYLHDGRYKSEFDEIRLIGKGGFAKVTEVRHKVDKQHYAVKRIPVKSPKNITLEKLSQEVTILAKLTKRPSPRIVRYHAAWLEEEYASGNSPKKEDDRPPALSSSSSSSSSLEELEEEGISFHDLNDDHSSASIVFEDTEGTPINESKAGQVSYFRSSSSITSVKETTVSKQGIYLYEKEEDIVQSGESVICHEQTSRRQVMDSEKFREQVAGAVALRHPRRRHSSKPMMKYVLCIQMELCGKTLSEWLRQRNNSQERDGLFSCVSHRKNIYILKQILEGIHFVHQQDILHRDLKPLNVFLTEPQLDVKIGDFGLAREVICQEEDDGELVNRRQFGRQLSTDIGTSPYIAPEQQHGGDYDSKADMYSFGIIKYEMFHPFSTGMERSICIKSLRDGGDIPTELVKSWPEEAKLIKDLTSQDKMLRPSASELLKRCTYCDHKQQAQESLQTELNHRDSVITEKNKELMDTRAELASKDEELKTLKEERELERREGEKRDAELEAMKRKLKEMEEKLETCHLTTAAEMKPPSLTEGTSKMDVESCQTGQKAPVNCVPVTQRGDTSSVVALAEGN